MCGHRCICAPTGCYFNPEVIYPLYSFDSPQVLVEWGKGSRLHLFSKSRDIQIFAINFPGKCHRVGSYCPSCKVSLFHF